MALRPDITAEQWQAYRNRMSPREWEEYCEKWRAYDRDCNEPPTYAPPSAAVPVQPYGQPYGQPYEPYAVQPYGQPYGTQYIAPTYGAPAKRSPKAKDIIRATWPCLLYFSLSFILGIIIAVVMMVPAMLGDEQADLEQVNRVLLYINYGVQLGMIPVFLVAFLRDRRKERSIGIDMGRHTLPSALLGVLAAVGLYFVVDGVLTFLLEALPGWLVNQYMEAMEQTMNAQSGMEWLAVISVVLLAPIMEELMMRGLVQKRLRVLMPEKAALFVAAVLFGVLHMNIIQGVYAFLLGLFLGWTYQKSKRLIVPILGHLAFNGMNYVYSAFLGAVEERPEFLGEELSRNLLEQTPSVLTVAMLAGALIALLALVLLSRTHRDRAETV